MNRLNLLEALSDNLRIDKQKCTFCGECVERCILDNLRMRLAPCREACPLGLNVQAYVQLIARGQEDKAREMVSRDLPFPEIIGRICDHPCEAQCHRGKITGQAVSIRALKRYLFEDRPYVPPQAAPHTGKRVAVVGAGPAGLLASFDLAVRGHDVTVMEADARPGGLMRWAIPSFRLPVEVLERELGVLDRLGVNFQCGAKVGREFSLETLEREFDAAILATGQGPDRRLGIEGEDLEGVYYALELLRAAKAGRVGRIGKRVVVIGGGNAAVDAAQTVLRLGAGQVTLVSLETRAEMPAFAHVLAQAAAEGVLLEPSWGPVRFTRFDGRVNGVELKRCLSVFDAAGRFSPTFDACQTTLLEADAVVVAIGQAGGTLDIGTSGASGTLKADPLTLQTSRPKVFLAGDCQVGPSSVIRAMASGRQAAVSVDRFLKGEHLRFNRGYEGPVVTQFEISLEGAVDRDRIQPPLRPFQGEGDFAELEGPCSPEQARREAERCYSCGQPEGRYRTCWFCLPCEVVCPEKALWVEIPYLLR
ncbi:MAG: FAD-dependent oxidoreductase [Thermodesulfobacteriota bacterium]